MSHSPAYRPRIPNWPRTYTPAKATAIKTTANTPPRHQAPVVVRRLENRLYRGAAYITILRRMYRGRRRLHRGSRGPSAGCPAPALQGGLPLPEGPTR